LKFLHLSVNLHIKIRVQSQTAVIWKFKLCRSCK